MALYRFLPDNVSPPVAWGRNSIGPESYFYLCDFITMKEKRPSSQEWASIVASLHRNSMGKSQGGILDSADVSLVRPHDEVNGIDEEMSRLKTGFLNKVIPRYLRPLESDGRSEEICMFDACAYWGRNEADLAICRSPRYKLGWACILEYLKHIFRR
ncbi:hypothetical protein MCOR02_009477 [Pyricularia oryzae]|uniref:Protein-ribulosamine 3-kinase n=1 Tax=Pyricularia grisea TaxID=148305 RepID=A0ABQ8NJX7_PYRGI|nr:hypothetical protein MCOR01_001692 [Pyricularia oryzae]KAI6298177.1 hypothetical protein MCOR33_005636 [Pyricularia grisea]KAH9429740.1 hypothetical protein MCOR02_009477 [Pyricularia oryzae]KAI6263066.1 hypothetical protein MCOR19_000706 [Pyricularia oryzae]KAI6281557.1 hypothetical protein MCOR26_003227 [Pyricularia oryzae]